MSMFKKVVSKAVDNAVNEVNDSVNVKKKVGESIERVKDSVNVKKKVGESIESVKDSVNIQKILTESIENTAYRYNPKAQLDDYLADEKSTVGQRVDGLKAKAEAEVKAEATPEISDGAAIVGGLVCVSLALTYWYVVIPVAAGLYAKSRYDAAEE